MQYTSSMEVVKRKSSRALLVTSNSEILLIKIGNSTNSWTGWITPGGGIDGHESDLEGLKRELEEELGLTSFNNEARVWSRFHKFEWSNKIIEQKEIFFLIRIEKFQPSPKSKLTETEMLEFKEIRWWSLEEIRNSKESFAPSQLCNYLTQLLAMKSLPVEPIDVGV